MKIVVAVRCYNESRNIERFLRCYDFADQIIVSDGGSEDDSVSKLEANPKVVLFHYENYEIVAGHRWNPDAMHINFVLNKAKELNPDWIIFDDMDDVPNFHLQKDARILLEQTDKSQVNVFRLYMWGDDKFFPRMNNNFDPNYKSLWAWKPDINIYADESIRHGTIVGTSADNLGLEPPYCLLHYSWNPDTIQAKVDRYNNLGLPMNHPLTFAGEPIPISEWARTE